jgi:hypothetical protein
VEENVIRSAPGVSERTMCVYVPIPPEVFRWDMSESMYLMLEKLKYFDFLTAQDSRGKVYPTRCMWTLVLNVVVGVYEQN